MAIGEAFQEHRRKMEEESESYQFECTDDSDDDPSFDIVEETRSAISKLSIKKPRARCKIVDDNVESESERDGVVDEIPKLDKKDEKSFEKVEQLIKEGGHLEKLTLDQCKVYLRHYGLRLTGNKGILISRIREHREIIDGCGEMKYPVESFVFNCKGDACLGDVVIFEQNVYDMFNIASRSATGPPCGTRTIAGRIVKESYGVAKQQHTFTIEVLWSKGVKPLPPLHQLLIKGRNLYRIKTMRQRWVDEGERLKVLQEKHGRGSRARYSREMRLKEKEKRTKGMVIKRKNLTADHIPADKENKNPEKADEVQQMSILNNKEHKHGGHKHHHHQAKHHGFQAFELRNSAHVRPHHVHQQHYKAKHHEFLHGGYIHMNQTSWVNHFIYVPLQQQYPEYQRRQPCHYFSQGLH